MPIVVVAELARTHHKTEAWTDPSTNQAHRPTTIGTGTTHDIGEACSSPPEERRVFMLWMERTLHSACVCPSSSELLSPGGSATAAALRCGSTASVPLHGRRHLPVQCSVRSPAAGICGPPPNLLSYEPHPYIICDASSTHSTQRHRATAARGVSSIARAWPAGKDGACLVYKGCRTATSPHTYDNLFQHIPQSSLEKLAIRCVQ